VRPVRKALGLLVKASVWAVTGAMLLLCVVFARLFYAPINLDFARDIVVEQVEGFLPGWQVDYRSAQIGWDWSAVRPWVLVEDIDLVDRRERLTARIPQAKVDVSFTGFFSGVSLAQVEAQKVNVHIINLAAFSDATDGSGFADLLIGEGVPKPEIFRPITEAFSRFTARLLGRAPGLDHIKFSNFHVELERGENLSSLAFTAPQFVLEHDAGQLQLSAQVDALFAGRPTRLNLSGNADPAAGDLAVTVAFNETSLAHLARETGLPTALTYFDFAVDVDLSLGMTAQDGLRAATAEISIGEGAVYDASAFPERSPIEYGIVSLAFDPFEQVLAIDELELSLGGNIVSGGGLLYWEDGHTNPGVRLELAADEVSVKDVQRYWPIKRHPDGTARGAREWVRQHMIGGSARNVSFDVAIEPDGTTPFDGGSIYRLDFDVADVDTLYLKTMSPILGAKGRAVLTRHYFDVFLDSGAVEGVPVAGSKAHMYDIHIPNGGKGEFDLKLTGPVPQILNILTPKPVDIAERLKIDLARIDGTADIEAKLRLPLIKGAPIDQIHYDIVADITEGKVGELLGGPGLSEATVKLVLDKDQLRASGNGSVNGVPLDLYWNEDFKRGRGDPGADTSLLVMNGDINQAGLLALGVDVGDYLHGDTLAEATFLGRNLKFRVGYFSADASAAVLTVPQIGWKKPVAVPANINGTVYFDDPGVRIEPLTINGEQIDADLKINWAGGDRRVFGAEISATSLGKSSFSAEIKSHATGEVQAVVEADHLDISGLLGDKIGGAPEEEASSSQSKVDLSIRAKKLEFLNGAILQGADAKLLFDGEPKLFALSGGTEFGITTLKISHSEAERSGFAINTADAGMLLRGLGLFAHMEGGNATFVGSTNGWGRDLSIEGRMNVKDSRLVAKNRLGEGVTEGVISGLDDYLDGGTVDLDIVKFPFTYNEGLLDLSKVKANGPSLGMTMEGQIDAVAGKINVNGVVVPAYGLNSLLGKIPLVGGLFSGGDGKGLFGVAYRVKGSTAEPNVNVNAMSGLAPGFLRVLFEGRKGNVDNVILPEEEAAEAAAEEAETQEAPQSEPPVETQPADKPAEDPNS
jgi:hypothetical protein